MGLPTVEASMAGNFRLNIGGRGFPAADSLVTVRFVAASIKQDHLQLQRAAKNMFRT